MQTIEKPPIIDFYRNTVDVEGGMSSRPSMLQLIHGNPQGVAGEVNELDEFKVCLNYNYRLCRLGLLFELEFVNE